MHALAAADSGDSNFLIPNGTFIVEILFALPGIGELTVQSIFSTDYLVVQGTVLLVAVGYVLVNFLVDLLYVVIDPRVRHAAAAS